MLLKTQPLLHWGLNALEFFTCHFKYIGNSTPCYRFKLNLILALRIYARNQGNYFSSKDFANLNMSRRGNLVFLTFQILPKVFPSCKVTTTWSQGYRHRALALCPCLFPEGVGLFGITQSNALTCISCTREAQGTCRLLWEAAGEIENGRRYRCEAMEERAGLDSVQ